MLDPNLSTLSGDPTCSELQYFSVIDNAPVISTDIRPILYARLKGNLGVSVNHTAISHLLHDGFVPQPLTVYDDVFVISTGVTAIVSDGIPRFEFDFPFTKAKSRQDSIPSADTLLALLASSTAEACEPGKSTLLMLSAGLDSTSLALAAKEAGLEDILCVTYAEDDDFEEATNARALCARLGLRHETFVLDMHSNTICDTLVSYAKLAPEPCADPALTACVAPISRHSSSSTVVLDGTGSDAYFWKPPRRLDLAKLHFGLSRLPIVGLLRGMVPMHLRHERLLSTPLELVLFSGPRLRHCDTRAFYPQSINTHRYWRDAFDHLQYPTEEVRSNTRSTFLGPAAHMMKTRNAVMTTGAVARFPWASPPVADYCFNLPAEHRFSREQKKGKIIVREMLRKFVDYDDERIGKRVFTFGKRRFMEQNVQFCRDEVLRCSLWSPQIQLVFESLAKRFRRGYRTENALLALLMVSLWHNHWVTERLVPTMHSQQSRSVAA